MPRTHIAARVRGWWALAALIGAATIVTAAAAGPAAAAPSQAADGAALQALAPPSLFTWGDEALGDLGNGVNGPDQLAVSFGKPDMIAASPAPIPLPASVRQLVAFNDDGMALLSNGTVATWGDGSYGQTGDGVRNISLIPIVLSGLTGITQIAGNGGDEMALDSSGTVWVWGNNYSGQARQRHTWRGDAHATAGPRAKRRGPDRGRRRV